MTERWFLFRRKEDGALLMHPEEHLPPSVHVWRCIAAGSYDAMQAAVRLMHS